MDYNSNDGIANESKVTLQCLPRVSTAGNLTRLPLSCIHQSIHLSNSLFFLSVFLSWFLLSCMYLPAWDDQCTVTNANQQKAGPWYWSMYSFHPYSTVAIKPIFPKFCSTNVAWIFWSNLERNRIWGKIGFNLEFGFNLDNLCAHRFYFLWKVV